MLNNIFIILAALFPCIIYMFMMWSTMPFSAIKIKPAFTYLILGMSSVLILNTMHRFLPGYFEPSVAEVFGVASLGQMFKKAYFIVAMPEELSKLLCFMIIEKIRPKSDKDHPVGTMFYFGMIGLSFGLVENISYAQTYGHGILIVRTFSALVLHMMMGLIAGYWYAFSKMKSEHMGRSLFSVVCFKYPTFRRRAYIFIGLLLVSFIHGTYDYNLFVPTITSMPLMITQLGVTALVTYLGARNLIKEFTKDKEKISS